MPDPRGPPIPRGNVAPLVQHGLAGLRRVRQHRGVHVDHHLVPLAGSAGIQLVMQRGFGQQRQRVGSAWLPPRTIAPSGDLPASDE